MRHPDAIPSADYLRFRDVTVIHNDRIHSQHDVWPGTVHIPRDCYCLVHVEFDRRPQWLERVEDDMLYVTNSEVLQELKTIQLLLT